MISVTVAGKSKSPSFPLLQRGRQSKATGVDARFFRIERNSFAATLLGWIPPFAKGGKGGFALGAIGSLS